MSEPEGVSQNVQVGGDFVQSNGILGDTISVNLDNPHTAVAGKGKSPKIRFSILFDAFATGGYLRN